MVTVTSPPLFRSAMFLLLGLILSGCSGIRAAQAPPREYLYVGTSNSRGSEGLYVYEFTRDDPALRLVQTVRDRRGPSFQAIHPSGGILYSVSSHRFVEGSEFGTVSAYRVDRQSGRLALINERPVRGNAHVGVDPQGRFVYVSDFGGGRLSAFRITPDGGLTEAVDVIQHSGRGVHPERQAVSHVHSVIAAPDGQFVYASDLGLDKVMIYAVDGGSGRLTPAVTPYVETKPGSGPRHFTIDRNGRFAYSVEEILPAVAAYAVDASTGGLTEIQRVEILPVDADTTGTSGADIHLSPDGRFLYASIRGYDHLIVFQVDPATGTLTLVGYQRTGRRPVNFEIDSTGEFVFVANSSDDTVWFFDRDRSTGELEFRGILAVPAPTSLTHLIVD